MSNFKVCPRCGERKPVSEFSQKRDTNGVFSPVSHCRVCRAAYGRKIYSATGRPMGRPPEPFDLSTLLIALLNREGL